MVCVGFVIAWRLAIWPTRRSPSSVNPTIEGVVRAPSRFGTTWGEPTSTTATQEFVVPRSIPRTLATRGLLRRPAIARRSGDFDARRPQQAVVQRVSLLKDLEDRSRRYGSCLLAHDGFVNVGVERGAESGDFGEPISAQSVVELLGA